MPRPVSSAALTYQDVLGLTDYPSMDAIYQAARGPGKKNRHSFTLNDLESIVLFLAAHGKPELRKKICGYSAAVYAEEDASLRRRKRSVSSKS